MVQKLGARRHNALKSTQGVLKRRYCFIVQADILDIDVTSH